MRRHDRALVLTLTALSLAVIGLPPSQTVAEACEQIQAELVGWWKFDEGAGYIVKDSSSYGNDGAIRGLAAFTTDALVGTAIDFSNSFDGVIVPNDKSLEPATGTFQAWIKVSDPQDSDIILKRTDLAVRSGEEGQFGVYGLRIKANGAITAYIMNDDIEKEDGRWTVTESKPGLILLGKWHQLVMRWDGKKFDLFVDGKKRDSVRYNPIPELGLSYHETGYFGLGLGTFWDGASGHEFLGQLDEVRLYNGPRTNWQIWEDYRLQGGDPATHPGKFLGHLKKKLERARREHITRRGWLKR